MSVRSHLDVSLSDGVTASAGRRSIARRVWVVAASTTLITLFALAMLVVSLLTLFRARRFSSEVLGKWLGRAVLRVSGVALVVHRSLPWPRDQAVYVANHTSTLDAFILLAMGIPRARFFLYGLYRKVPPIALIGASIGIFFTPSQSDRNARVRCFQNAERILRRTGDSVFLSPEGMRVTTGEIGAFNKGAFHLATSLGAPIVPLYIAIPGHINPGTGSNVGRGTVEVYVQPAIPTLDWRLEDLEQHKAEVREIFIRLNERFRQP